jgi:hypothetical protein
MTSSAINPTRLTDDELLAEVTRLAGAERRATAALIRSLMELDARRLYLGEGCSSLFTYCTQVLHLAEGSAYNRIEAARAARRFPLILDALEQGSLTVTAVRLLSSHLTPANHQEVVAAARHKSKREVEVLIAALDPKPAAPPVVRKLPAPRAAGPRPNVAVPDVPQIQNPVPVAAGRTESMAPPVATPLAPERYKLQLTISRGTHDKLRHAQDLLRHVVPNGDPAEIFDRALTLLLEDLERRRCAATPTPRPSRQRTGGSRHIPAAVRREVWKRDDGQCAFVGTKGRCKERGFLEFHHVEPYAAGGLASAENIELRCRAHNAYEAALYFGDRDEGVREARPLWPIGG